MCCRAPSTCIQKNCGCCYWHTLLAPAADRRCCCCRTLVVLLFCLHKSLYSARWLTEAVELGVRWLQGTDLHRARARGARAGLPMMQGRDCCSAASAVALPSLPADTGPASVEEYMTVCLTVRTVRTSREQSPAADQFMRCGGAPMGVKVVLQTFSNLSKRSVDSAGHAGVCVCAGVPSCAAAAHARSDDQRRPAWRVRG